MNDVLKSLNIISHADINTPQHSGYTRVTLWLLCTRDQTLKVYKNLNKYVKRVTQIISGKSQREATNQGKNYTTEPRTSEN